MKKYIRHGAAAFWMATALVVTSCGTSSGVKGSTQPYPLNVCIVSGNELGSMGPVITRVYDGRQLKFCCKPCIAKFDAEPSRYLEKLKN